MEKKNNNNELNKQLNENEEHRIKIVIIGDQAVGKSSIMLRYTENIFTKNMMGTAGVDVRKKQLTYEGKPVRLLIYDSAGHERFRQITSTQFKGAQGILLVYDLSDKKTFENVTNWIKSIKENADYGVEIFLVGNKMDLEKQVELADEESLSLKYDIPYIETSALTGENVGEAFQLIVNKIMKKEIKLKTEEDFKSMNQNIVLHETPKKKKKCCGS